ncbi:MAG: ParB/RepB/Spo0J family partition protein [Microlunatus sp.]|nr:ParB/RepB/Spo0J family partition protein [Microlunatus sp.]MDN5771845.1 ParB/RepB/Spo0J family partition protein [Microlunatus sp.]
MTDRTATERRGLGRGLGELFQRTDLVPEQQRPPSEVVGTVTETVHGASPSAERNDAAPAVASPTPIPDGSYFAEIALDAITPNPRQPRTAFDEDAMAELVDSIGEVGLLQPVVVRPLGHDRFELVMGERRWRACQQAGLQVIPAIVRETETHDLLRDALLENLHRAQLNPLEEAAAYQQMLQDFNCTQEELATRIKRSRPQISNTIRLLRLPPTVQRRVAAGVLSAGHARALLALPDQAGQERLAQRVVAEGLSVRATEEMVTLGDPDQGTSTQRSPRSVREPHPRASEIAGHLADRLDTRVRVDTGKTRGRLTIDFASTDDLERIAGLLLR